ncbi:MAG: hypothetical protein M1829_005626 [Trizodia sp. TS-e1964]|nr:MAG: hypothetical protein M1829_005626 [Trizodia sp. TS-e1964]
MPPRTTLLTLPPELRLKIYAHLLTTRHLIPPLAISPHPLALAKPKRAKPPLRRPQRIYTALLRTCRLLHAEGLPVLYGANTFQLTPHILSLRPSVMRHIVHLEVCGGARDVRDVLVRSLFYVRRGAFAGVRELWVSVFEEVGDVGEEIKAAVDVWVACVRVERVVANGELRPWARSVVGKARARGLQGGVAWAWDDLAWAADRAEAGRREKMRRARVARWWGGVVLAVLGGLVGVWWAVLLARG